MSAVWNAARDDHILAGDFLRGRALSLQANRADLTRRRGAECLNLKRRHFGVADLLRQTFPHRPDRILTPHDAGAWRVTPQRRPCRGMHPAKSPLLKKSTHFAFTASISVFWASAGDQPGRENKYQCNPAHDQLRSCIRDLMVSDGGVYP